MIRQHFYCKRINYWRYCMRYTGYQSYKMEKGAEYHEKREKRNLSYDQQIWVENENLNLAGYADYMRKKQKEEWIIGDFKQKKPYQQEIPEHYKMQLVAEVMAMDIGDRVREEVEIQIKNGKVIKEKIREEEKQKVLEAIKEIQLIIETELLPEETEQERKCVDCEYRNICQPSSY